MPWAPLVEERATPQPTRSTQQQRFAEHEPGQDDPRRPRVCEQQYHSKHWNDYEKDVADADDPPQAGCTVFPVVSHRWAGTRLGTFGLGAMSRSLPGW